MNLIFSPLKRWSKSGKWQLRLLQDKTKIKWWGLREHIVIQFFHANFTPFHYFFPFIWNSYCIASCNKYEKKKTPTKKQATDSLHFTQLSNIFCRIRLMCHWSIISLNDTLSYPAKYSKKMQGKIIMLVNGNLWCHIF